MKVNYNIRSKSNKNSAINAIVYFNGKRYKFSTGLRVRVLSWNVKNMRANIKGYPDATLLNVQLDQLEAELLTLFNRYTVARIIPSLEQVKEDYLRFKSEKMPDGEYSHWGIAKPNKRSDFGQNKCSRESEQFFVPFFVKYVEESNYKIGTRKKYRSVATWLIKFETKFRVKLTFDDIDLAFYDQFQKYVTTQTYKPTKDSTPRNYSLNYLGTFIKCIKHVMREAGPEGRYNLHSNSIYRSKQFKVEQETADTIYLSVDELKKIHEFEPTVHNISEVVQDPRVELRLRAVRAYNLAKNKFLVGAFTALRVSDFNRLEEINIKENAIRIKPKKGVKKNEDVVIPIHPIVKEILESGFDISAPITDQHINLNIKKVCRLVGLDDIVSVYRTEGGKLIERKFKKWELVCTHTARRSGATNMYLAGVPSISIMKITGHKTENSFMKYIKISQEENAKLLADHSFFKM